MLNRIVRIILSVSLVGCTFLTNNLETSETEVETSETTVYFEQNTDVISQLKDEIHETRNWDKGCTDNTIQISYDDAQILLKIAAAEAGGEDVEGQLYVMETVWNRVMLEDNFYYFPGSIEEVVFQEGAFTTVTEGKYDAAEPNYRTHLALAKFESNIDLDKEVLGFETIDNGQALLQYFDMYKIHGGHVLYKAKKED